MGGANSKTRSGNSSRSVSKHLNKSSEEVVRLMMPVYYNDEPISTNEHELAHNSWKLILNNTSPEFLARKNDPNFTYPACIMFFYNSFYTRLFDIHPLAKELFKDMKSQGKFLVKMISLSLSESNDVDKYERTLIKLAEIHNDRGVKAVEYGLVGEVLFWSIRNCVGPTVYTNEVHNAWVKIYSRMLKTMVPVAVAYELEDGSAQEKRFFGDSIGLSMAEESVLNNIEEQSKLKENSISGHVTTYSNDGEV